MKPDGIEVNYNGNEDDENAEKMVFKKPEKEILNGNLIWTRLKLPR